MRYIADPPAERRLIARDDVYIIYHRPSGMTHVVATPVPEILDALGQGPADIAGLIERLPPDWELDAEDAPALAARIAELVASGLVRAA